MPRTTPELVQTLVDVGDGVDLTSFIDTANSLVTDVCTNSGYSNVKLELIERWLSCHFYVIYDPRNAMEGVGGGTQEQREILRVDLGLNLTKYGQAAMRIDSAGNLAALENSMRTVKTTLAASRGAESRWLGTARRPHGFRS